MTGRDVHLVLRDSRENSWLWVHPFRPFAHFGMFVDTNVREVRNRCDRLKPVIRTNVVYAALRSNGKQPTRT